jgi:hypothetical protein
MKNALEDAGWHEEFVCGRPRFGIDSVLFTMSWHSRAELKGTLQLRKTDCNPNVVVSPIVDLAQLAVIPREYGSLHLELKYKFKRCIYASVDVLLVEDGLERTVAVLENGRDEEWHSLKKWNQLHKKRFR